MSVRLWWLPDPILAMGGLTVGVDPNRQPNSQPLGAKRHLSEYLGCTGRPITIHSCVNLAKPACNRQIVAISTERGSIGKHLVQ